MKTPRRAVWQNDDAPMRPNLSFDFHLRPKTLAQVLLLIVGFLTVFSLVGQYSTYFRGDGFMQGFVPQFNLDREMNIPTWFSSACFLFAALLLWQLAGADIRPARRFWRGLSLVFAFLSLDETAALHEIAVDPMRRLFHARGLLHFAWVIPGAAFVALLALLYGRFLLSQPRPTRRWFILSAVLFLAGTLGMEMIGGLQVERHGSDNFVYALFANIEESLELFGLVTFLYALMDRLQGISAANPAE